MRPHINQVTKLIELKDEVKALYKEIDELTSAIVAECGFGRVDYDLEDVDTVKDAVGVDALKRDGRYLKLEIVDNLERLTADGVFFTTASFKPVSVNTRTLKTKPKSLK